MEIKNWISWTNDNRKKPGFNLIGHMTVGLRLSKMQNEMQTIAMALSRSYPAKDKVHRYTANILNDFLELRSHLDNCLSKEHIEQGAHQLAHCYYPISSHSSN